MASTQYLFDSFHPSFSPLLLRFIVSDDFLLCRAMDGQHMRDGEGFIPPYLKISRESFEEASKFYQQIFRIESRGNFSMVLVGNKRDLEYKRQGGER